MALSNNDQARVREYLLGNLSDQDQEKLEERLMTEDDLFEELEISKGELIEEYRTGGLTEAEHRWFERNYLATVEGKERYTFVAALDCVERPAPLPAPGFFERLVSAMRIPRWSLVPAAVGLVVVIAAVLILRPGPQTPVAITLTNTALSRGNGDTNALPLKITLPSNTSEVRASLSLPKSFPPQTSFRALLDNRTEKTPVKVTGYNDNNVSVVIPGKDLPPGEYALELTAILMDGTEVAIPGDYRFVVD